jgi:spermidine synthase
MDVQAVPDPRAMAARLTAPLLDIVRLSPEFRPAYDPLLRIAGALAGRDPEAAEALLHDLEQANPARPEAARQRAALAAARRDAAKP